MRTMLTGRLNLLCWLILTLKNVESEQPTIHEVKSAVLRKFIHFYSKYRLIIEEARRGSVSSSRILLFSILPESLPYQLNDDYLLHMDEERRLQLCSRMRDKIPRPYFPSKVSAVSYAPKAYVYKFDDKEEKLAVRCPTLPPFYVSHEMIDLVSHHWHIRIEKPPMEHYEFRFETVEDVRISTGSKFSFFFLCEKIAFRIDIRMVSHIQISMIRRRQ